MHESPSPRHAWLEHLIGEWSFQGAATIDEQGQPGEGSSCEGIERVRAFSDLWIIAEGEMPVPEGEPMRYTMTLGYDPRTDRFRGTWFCTMMTHMFLYEGTLDDTERLLPLDTRGPAFHAPTQMADYRDIIELTGEGTRTLSSECPGPDGAWVRFMRAEYRRVR